MTRTKTPAARDERTQLTTALTYVRDTVRAKCAGLSDEDARRSLLPGSPLMTVAGLVHHLRWVEYFWFRVVFLGEESRVPWTDEEPDREMLLALRVPLSRLLAEYAEEAARHDAAVAGYGLDARARVERRGRFVDLRWIMLHLVEETARHNGHLDILGELTDGVVGD
ncbi:DinB family protein [Streptomyces sp. J2-1]|uniref:DinB family protein n=1 Tax=Streptomyces corallincola TaxID=2851888 RepID=UPI001C381181|nr:DinB family protein [Streptomyces corallincola]MBV2353278.1 DinB family protein [Streptomyces corallincola]